MDFNAHGLEGGVYVYSLRLNGRATDAQKMTIVK